MIHCVCVSPAQESSAQELSTFGFRERNPCNKNDIIFLKNTFAIFSNRPRLCAHAVMALVYADRLVFLHACAEGQYTSVCSQEHPSMLPLPQTRFLPMGAGSFLAITSDGCVFELEPSTSMVARFSILPLAATNPPPPPRPTQGCSLLPVSSSPRLRRSTPSAVIPAANANASALSAAAPVAGTPVVVMPVANNNAPAALIATLAVVSSEPPAVHSPVSVLLAADISPAIIPPPPNFPAPIASDSSLMPRPQSSPTVAVPGKEAADPIINTRPLNVVLPSVLDASPSPDLGETTPSRRKPPPPPVAPKPAAKNNI